MLGKFQQSKLRIEVESSATNIRDSLLHPSVTKRWVVATSFPSEMPSELTSGYEFTSKLGLVAIHHRVDVATNNSLRLILSQGIDGFHEWYWGEGWVQSRIEGISLLPIALGQTVNLLSLRQFLKRQVQR
ncbi:hypothetical protein [Calothrix sp. 336/3]|uniref:hypothetical protein n=1 Tax=Calothrix sp. 336/3 TaxID=1337936 RepID=UPI0004E32368|nr:hypothetical protein [Calothrix sp. 336/3]AKG22325.1 hypothetical protein IJ00_14570 [Calothrix sp. 336/3]